MHIQDHLQSPKAILPKWCEPTEKARAVQIVRKLIKLLMLVCPLVYCRCNRCPPCEPPKTNWTHSQCWGEKQVETYQSWQIQSKPKIPSIYRQISKTREASSVATVACKAMELDLVWGWRDIDKVKQKGFQLLQRLTWGEDSNPCNNKITLKGSHPS